MKVFVYIEGQFKPVEIGFNILADWSCASHVYETAEKAVDALLSPLEEGWVFLDSRTREEILARTKTEEVSDIFFEKKGCLIKIRRIIAMEVE